MPDPDTVPTLHDALDAWSRSTESRHWPAPTSILIAERFGRWLAWPRSDDQSFFVIDVISGRMIDEEELPREHALRLDWRTPLVSARH